MLASVLADTINGPTVGAVVGLLVVLLVVAGLAAAAMSSFFRSKQS